MFCSRMCNASPMTVIPICMVGRRQVCYPGAGVVLSRGGGGHVHRGCVVHHPLQDQALPPNHVTYPMIYLVSHIPSPVFSDRMTDACENITFASFG